MSTIKGNDNSCTLISCSDISAQVNCIKDIHQGTDDYIDIQLFDKFGNALDLDYVNKIEIALFDEFDCLLGNFNYDKNSDTVNDIIILQEYINTYYLTNKGLIKIFIDENITSNIPSSIFAEIRLTLLYNESLNTYINTNTGDTGDTGDDVIKEYTKGMLCFKIANIISSKIYEINNYEEE